MEPLSAPVVLHVALPIFQVSDSALEAVALDTLGSVPPVWSVTRPKFVASTPETGSLKVTVQCSGPALVGLASPDLRSMETAGGGVGLKVSESVVSDAVLCVLTAASMAPP